MTSSVDTYYNALLAADRVRELNITEARRDLAKIILKALPPLDRT